MKIVNVAAYKFITLKKELLPKLQRAVCNKGMAFQLKGTILLSCEGINLMLAGKHEAIFGFQTFLENFPEFNELLYKKSFSSTCPFKKFIVRIKKEIITMHCPDINPGKGTTAPHISPETLYRWYQENHDMVVLDIRNHFEITMGTFVNAMNLNLQSFSDFPWAINKLPQPLKEKLIVTCCTGGIRCEKATAAMLKKGFKKVYQLNGGILNYFDTCGRAFFKGKCFVFDNRMSIEAT